MKFAMVMVLIAACNSVLAQSVGGGLRAGAARVDITPDEKHLPKGFEGINDRIFVRAIVVDDGQSRGALVTVDANS